MIVIREEFYRIRSGGLFSRLTHRGRSRPPGTDPAQICLNVLLCAFFRWRFGRWIGSSSKLHCRFYKF